MFEAQACFTQAVSSKDLCFTDALCRLGHSLYLIVFEQNRMPIYHCVAVITDSILIDADIKGAGVKQRRTYYKIESFITEN